MKLEFEGWSRVVHLHKHAVKAVVSGKNGYRPKQGPINWESGLEAIGKVEGLSLTGDFLVRFSFDEEDMKNWLLTYAAAYPEAALRLMGHAQAEAVIALNASHHEST